MGNTKQEFPCQSLENFSRKYCKMENKILGFQFEPVCDKQTRQNYSVGSDQDEAEIQHDRLSTNEQWKWKFRMRIPAVKISYLKFKARPLWETAILEFSAVEFNCVGNHFLEEFFSEIS